MIPSDKSFQLKIKREFLNKENKNGLFRTLRSELRAYLRYPADYIMKFLEMLSEPMPLHAAVSAGYFRQHGCVPDKMPVFMAELRNKCEQNFIREAESPEPDLQKCADLHSAFSYLNPEYAGTEIPEAVEKLSENQRKTLFQEVGRCIHAAHDITQEERDLLDPVLKYFSLHYPEEINNDFLEKNQEQFSGLIPRETTLSELFISAVKKQHFSYFRILYALFPGWHMNQNDITSEAFTELSFQYADSPAHLLDLLYVSMELSKQGHSYYQVSQLRQWQDKILEFKPEASVQQVISYLFYAHCIQSAVSQEQTAEYIAAEQIAGFVHDMPVYEPDALFSEILPAQRFPVGSIFVQQNTETILKHDSSLLKEYLSKIGKNNIYHFNMVHVLHIDTEFRCPDVEPTDNFDYVAIIKNIALNHTAEELLHFYFNTHLKALFSPWEIYDFIRNCILEIGFIQSLKKYTFVGSIDYDSKTDSYFLSDTQFKCPQKTKISAYYLMQVEYFIEEYRIINIKDMELFNIIFKNRLKLRTKFRIRNFASASDACASIEIIMPSENKKKVTYDAKKLPDFVRLREVIRILIRACADENVITEPPQEIFSIPERLIVYPMEREDQYTTVIEEILVETVLNRILAGHAQKLFRYFEVIEKVNPYHNGNILNLSLQEDRLKIYMRTAEVCRQKLPFVVSSCTPELLAVIFRETPFRTFCSLSQWFALLWKYGKIDEFMENIRDFTVIYGNNYEEVKSAWNQKKSSLLADCSLSKEKKLLIENSLNTIEQMLLEDCITTPPEQLWNIKPGNYQIINAETFDNRETNRKKYFRISGYDAEQDIVFLTEFNP